MWQLFKIYFLNIFLKSLVLLELLRRLDYLSHSIGDETTKDLAGFTYQSSPLWVSLLQQFSGCNWKYWYLWCVISILVDLCIVSFSSGLQVVLLVDWLELASTWSMPPWDNMPPQDHMSLKMGEDHRNVEFIWHIAEVWWSSKDRKVLHTFNHRFWWSILI